MDYPEYTPWTSRDHHVNARPQNDDAAKALFINNFGRDKGLSLYAYYETRRWVGLDILGAYVETVAWSLKLLYASVGR